MSQPELVKVVELHNSDLAPGQIDLDSGKPTDDLLDILLRGLPYGKGVHAQIIEYGALLISRFLVCR